MYDQSDFTDYYQVERNLATLSCLSTPAEIHGAACGILSLNLSSDDAQWLNHIFADNTLPTETRPDTQPNTNSDIQFTQKFFSFTRQQLLDDEFNFNLLLVDDDEPLQARIDSLQEWLEGYLQGISLSGLKRFSDLPGDTSELLTDFSNIAAVEEVTFDENNEAESDYNQLVEYVRMGVLVILAECSVNT